MSQFYSYACVVSLIYDFVMKDDHRKNNNINCYLIGRNYASISENI